MLNKLVWILAAALLAGCGQKSEAPAPTAAAPAAPAKASEEHDAHGHAGHNHGSGHVHKALQGGELVEVGEHQFNVELKFDATRGVLQLWVLDAHAENYVRIAATTLTLQEEEGAKRTITLRPLANALTGETVGDSATFEGDAPWLREVKHFDGTLKGLKVRGVDFPDLDLHFHP